MFKVIMFVCEPQFTRLKCLDLLAEFLNLYGDISVVDIEKEWNTINEYQYSLKCYVTVYDLDIND